MMPSAPARWVRLASCQSLTVQTVSAASRSAATDGQFTALSVPHWSTRWVNHVGAVASASDSPVSAQFGATDAAVRCSGSTAESAASAPSQNDERRPSWGPPVRGGVSSRAAHNAMEYVAERGDHLRPLKLVELNPILDDHNATAELAVELVASPFGKRVL